MGKLRVAAAFTALGAVASILTGCGRSDSAATESELDAAADKRAGELVSQLTLDEKVQLVHGTGMPLMARTMGMAVPPGALYGSGFIPGIPRLGIPDLNMADSTTGVLVSDATTDVTALPAPIGLAASWNTQLAHDYGARIATELRTLGYGEGLGGAVNLASEPRSGRTFENLGEDPVLAGALVAARTRGTQSQQVIGTIKHYAMNDQETDRATIDAQTDERTMRETELLAFEIGVREGQPGNVMCSYNKVNGTHACENPYLLTEVLKNEWDYRGVVQSDWGATHTTEQAVTAGLDEEEPGAAMALPPEMASGMGSQPGPHFAVSLKDAVTSGLVPMERLDDMVKRKLRTMIRLGVMDNPPAPGGKLDLKAGAATALDVARKSMVLLKNDSIGTSPALPLDQKVRSIAVIGGHADKAVLSGGGSGQAGGASGLFGCQQPPAMLFGGCAPWHMSSPLDAIRAKVPGAAVTWTDGTDLVAASEAARAADVAIVFATQWQTEGQDLVTLSLPGPAEDPFNQSYDQNSLVDAVAGNAKRTVVVLENGSPVLMPWHDRVHAVLEAWYPGEQGAQAIADVLFGQVNPSGRLPLTFPTTDETVSPPPDSGYHQGLLIGYRRYQAENVAPLFPFGYGLSYTTFRYSNLNTTTRDDGAVTVTVTVTNAGSRTGTDTTQIYAGLPAGLGEPPQRLVGWQQTTLEPGKSQEISVTIPSQRLATWDAASDSWRDNPGEYSFHAARFAGDPDAPRSSVRLH